MPMDDTDHDLGEPTPPPRSRDNRDDRDDSTPERVAERVARNELPREEGAPPDEHPEDGRSGAAEEPAAEGGPRDER